MIPARPLSYDEFPSSPLGCEGMVVLPVDLDNVTAHLMEPIVYVNRDGLDLTLRLILAGDCLELFVTDGERTLTALLDTPAEADGISLHSEGAVTLELVQHTLH